MKFTNPSCLLIISSQYEKMIFFFPKKENSKKDLPNSFNVPNIASKIKLYPAHLKNNSMSSLNFSFALPKVKNSSSMSRSSLGFFAKSTVLSTKTSVSSKSWILYDCSKCQRIEGTSEHVRSEIASLTKIMTLYVCLEETKKNKVDLKEYLKVSLNAASINGTNSGLEHNDTLRVIDLLYALMLPSGNDASVALAEYFGGFCDGNEENLQKFVRKMNKTAKELGLENTFFSNPHGMSTSINLSTASDIAILSAVCMKNALFRKIVNTSKYFCQISNKNCVRTAEWNNTNKMLQRGFEGIKTGFTPLAGPCFCCGFHCKNNFYIIVLLGCISKHARWTDAMKVKKIIVE